MRESGWAQQRVPDLLQPFDGSSLSRFGLQSPYGLDVDLVSQPALT